MSDHYTLSPDILDKLISSIQGIKPHWETAVTNLDAEKARSESLMRELNLATDRVSYVQADLAELRTENRALLERNAYLEAQCQRLFDLTRSASDDMAIIADQAVQVAREIPASRQVRDDGTTTDRPTTVVAQAAARPAPQAPERTLQDAHVEREVDDDGTGLTQERPAFLRTPMPDNVFGSQS